MKKNKKKINFLIFIIVFIYLFTFLYTLNYYIESDKNNYKKLIFDNNKIFTNFISFISNIDLNSPNTYINNNKKFNNTNNSFIKPVSKEIEKNPIVYIYNTHQEEKYKNNNDLVNPNVTINDYIIKENLEKNNIYVTVEENSIKKYLEDNNYNYSKSYVASRFFLEKAYKENNKLKFFIDIHRDSIDYNKTTLKFNNKVYAKVLFIVGLENEKYLDNLKVTEKISDMINSKVPNLSKGIYKKQGKGVNGVYNQDFNKNTILIEVGGVDNNIEEVSNTAKIISDVLIEYINGVNNES